MPASSIADRSMSRGSAEDRITEQLTARIGPHKYDMWFGHTRLRIEEGRLEVATDSAYVAPTREPRGGVLGSDGDVL